MPGVAINAALNAKTREDKTSKEHTMWKNQAIEINTSSQWCARRNCVLQSKSRQESNRECQW